VSTEKKRNWVDNALRIFGDVRGGEGITALLMTTALFLILVAYYIIKVAREPLILASGGAEMKSYAAAGQAVLLLGFVPAYSWFAGRVERMKLIVGVTLFFVACIELFFVGAGIGIPYLGIAFYIWVGIFGVAIIAQFWSYANEFYTRPEGERLFPLVAVGAALGSVVGSKVAKILFDQMKLGPYVILQVSAAVLVLHLGVYWLINRSPRSDAAKAEVAVDEAKPAGTNGFTLVFQSRYLRLIAVMLILLNVVNTTGEYILATMVEDAAIAATGATDGPEFQRFIGAFYGDYFFYVNLGTVAIQALVVSRIVKVAGIAGVLFALPVVAFGTYGLVAFGVGLGAMRWAKSAENMTDYSVMNTAKAMLWLPTSPEEKYNAKQAIDTFFVRLGDVLSALLVFVGTTYLAFDVQRFAITNLVICGLWAFVCWWVLQEYRALAKEKEA
jgi:ATP:ADP antiporter, AAA family